MPRSPTILVDSAAASFIVAYLVRSAWTMWTLGRLPSSDATFCSVAGLLRTRPTTRFCGSSEMLLRKPYWASIRQEIGDKELSM